MSGMRKWQRTDMTGILENKHGWQRKTAACASLKAVTWLISQLTLSFPTSLQDSLQWPPPPSTTYASTLPPSLPPTSLLTTLSLCVPCFLLPGHLCALMNEGQTWKEEGRTWHGRSLCPFSPMPVPTILQFSSHDLVVYHVFVEHDILGSSFTPTLSTI